MRKILQIDGGGVRGIIPLAILVEIEKNIGPCYKNFDLMSGTSTGSIICGMLAAGIPAQVLYDLYVKDGKKLFKKKSWLSSIFGSKYDRSDLLETMHEMLRIYGRGTKLGDVRTNFMSTTFNGVTGRTHFQMSWDNYHRGLDLVQVVAWSSLSAVHYFGPIAVPDYEYDMDYQVTTPYRTKGAVFYDGGQGRNNCTLNEVITTAVIKDYIHEECHILSLGTGSQKLYLPYKDVLEKSKISELKSYVTEERQEGVYDQLHKAKALGSHLPNLKIHRMDCVLAAKEDSLDALDYIPNFVKLGKCLVPQIPRVFLGV